MIAPGAVEVTLQRRGWRWYFVAAMWLAHEWCPTDSGYAVTDDYGDMVGVSRP